VAASLFTGEHHPLVWAVALFSGGHLPPPPVHLPPAPVDVALCDVARRALVVTVRRRWTSTCVTCGDTTVGRWPSP